MWLGRKTVVAGLPPRRNPSLKFEHTLHSLILKYTLDTSLNPSLQTEEIIPLHNPLLEGPV